MVDTVPSKRPPEGLDREDGEAKRKKQEQADRMAAIRARMAGRKTGQAPAIHSSAQPEPATIAPASPGPPMSDAEAQRAKAAKKIAEIKARMQARNGAPAALPTPPPPTDIQAQLLEDRAKAAALAKQQAASPINERESGYGEARGGLSSGLHPSLRDDSSRPTRTLTPDRVHRGSPAATDAPKIAEVRGGRGGLSVGLHPSLLQDSASRLSAGQRGSKFSTTRGNAKPEKPRENPYLTDEQDLKELQGKVNLRKSKPLSFFEHGKFIAQGNAQREAAELEEMKRRIAHDARKTEMEEASDRAFMVPKPPSIEWWDEAALPDGYTSYDSLGTDLSKLAMDNEKITNLVCHPVLLQPPQEKFLQPMKALMLTSKEMAKLRRQRRRADMKEDQARIRMGLVPPPPPKVKKSNMMRVLGEQAVKDPTAVEARVNREIAQRQHDHEQSNAERALTKEQRVEKLKSQQAGDAARGLKIAVFRVDDLSSGKHRYQVDIGAKQNALTGVVVMNPTMYLIIVEGGEHSMKTYKKLLLNRIKWTINEPPKADSNPTTFTGTRSGDGVKGKGSKAAEWCNPYHDNGSLKDLGANRCVLVWEGDETESKFKKWEPRTCETDGEAKDFLKRAQMENMWTLARSK